MFKMRNFSRPRYPTRLARLPETLRKTRSRVRKLLRHDVMNVSNRVLFSTFPPADRWTNLQTDRHIFMPHITVIETRSGSGPYRKFGQRRKSQGALIDLCKSIPLGRNTFFAGSISQTHTHTLTQERTFAQERLQAHS